MIRPGLLGFFYSDWVGPVYPPDLPRAQWLPFIALEFDTLEPNVTYYRAPSTRMVVSWTERTPDDFLFSVKALHSLIHEREVPDFAVFRAALQPLIEAGKLGCVLAHPLRLSRHAGEPGLLAAPAGEAGRRPPGA